MAPEEEILEAPPELRLDDEEEMEEDLWFPPKRQWWLDIDANVSSLATV